MRTCFRISTSLAIAAAILAALVLPAFAHASVVFSTPAANAVLEKAPGRVTISFSEAVEPGFSRIQVLSTDGSRVDKNDTQLVAGLSNALGVSLDDFQTGTYTVAWRALSA